MGSSIRYIVGGAIAAAVTLGLFAIMITLIGRPPEIDEKEKIKVVDIQMPDLEIEVNVKETRPDKPETPDEPPPDFETPQVAVANVDTSLNVGYAQKLDVKIGGPGLAVSDGEYLPIVKVAPIYPNRAAQRGIEGHCTVEYVVTTSGAIRDPFVVEEDCTSSLFKNASVKAALKFKYKPRVIDGAAVEVAGVRNRFTYKLDK